MGKKILFLILGNLIIGIAIGVTLYCDFGIDACTTLYNGISLKIGIGLGNTNALMNSLLFIPMFLINKKSINIGTFINMFCIGYIVEYTSLFLNLSLGPISLMIRIVLYLFAVLILCVGIGMYLSTNLGQAPWDAVAYLIMQVRKKGNYAKLRMLQDLSALFIGFLLGSVVGVGTFILAFSLGPGINCSRKYFEKLL